ncbi:hypothetical protein MKY95_10060 [Paenibacillus sp. FSL P4-0176]|uniref:hypothetical protein n=1 Tax=Paenibacillus sp. FSL P4-0176 TaxID=2921631 RepID=UPI0030D21673
MTNKLHGWYIEDDILTIRMMVETEKSFKYDLVITVDRQNKTYNYVDNPYFENEKIKNENQISNEEMESELAECVSGILLGLSTTQSLVDDPDYVEYTDSILDWL